MNLSTPKNFTNRAKQPPSSTIFGVVNQSPFLSRHDLIKQPIIPALTSASTGIVLSDKTTGRRLEGMEMFFENGYFDDENGCLHISNFKYWHFSTVDGGATQLISWYVDSLFRVYPIVDNALRVSNILSVVKPSGIETVPGLTLVKDQGATWLPWLRVIPSRDSLIQEKQINLVVPPARPFGICPTFFGLAWISHV